MTRRIAILHMEGNIDHNPNLFSIVKTLLDEGYSIDYFFHYEVTVIFSFAEDENFNFYYVPSGVSFSLIRSPYNFCIAIDECIVDAAVWKHEMGIPFCLLSYEIFFLNEASEKDDIRRVLNIKEACKAVDFIIIQDSLRKKLLFEEYEIDAPCIYMPVAGENIVPFQRSTLLHKLCGIPEDKKILLYMGSLGAWAKTDWLVSKASSLPSPWVLVIHAALGKKHLSNKISASTSDNVFYSWQPLNSVGEMRRLIQSASCCIGIYTPTYRDRLQGKNIEAVGLSSGKIAMSLQHGVPVAVNRSPLLAEIVEKKRCGWVIDLEADKPFEDIDKKIANISVAQCHAAFQSVWDYANARPHFLKNVADAVTTGNGFGIKPGQFSANIVLQGLKNLPRPELQKLCRDLLTEIIRRGLAKIRLKLKFNMIHWK